MSAPTPDSMAPGPTGAGGVRPWRVPTVSRYRDRLRHTEQEALAVAAADRAQRLELLARLDPLGHHVDVEGRAERDDRGGSIARPFGSSHWTVAERSSLSSDHGIRVIAASG